MKKFTLLLIFVASGLFASAQGAAPLSKGEQQMNFGISFDGQGIPLYFGMDWAVHNDITVGGMAAFNLDGLDYLNLAARGDYHFNRLLNIPSDWDFYAGANLGFRLGFSDYNGDDGLDLGAQIGGRWFWSDKWGLMLEGGGGQLGSGGRIGLTMKM